MKALVALLAILVSAPALQALECREITYQENRYATCELDAAEADMRLFLNDDSGQPFGHFSSIDQALADQGKTLIFGMNAGMYHTDRAPVGHYVEDGTQVMRVIESPGPGNFGLLPNGIFCIRDTRADVIETLQFQAQPPDCRYATQSGPMLVIDGALHPRFLKDSTSRYVRNGVGTSADGRRVVFVISRDAVNFHSFGSLFKDGLRTPNALYFDGNISRLHAPALGRSDLGFRMGPVVGVVADKPAP